MADGTITILDENGGTIKERLSFQKTNNGYGLIHKNHSSDADYGMQIRDIDADSNSATLQISGDSQQAYLILQKAGDTSSSRYELYHTGNKPTVSEIGAAPANAHYIRTYTSLTQIGLTIGSETIESIVTSLPVNSRLLCSIGASSAKIYPSSYGTLIVDKIDTYRTVLNFYLKESNKCYFGVYDANKGTPWGGWSLIYNEDNSPTAADVGAVAKTGDTMTGSLEIESSSYPILKLHNTTSNSACTISGNPNATYIAAYNVDNDSDNFRTLVIADSNAFSDVKDALRMIDRVDGESTYYKIYGTHNKPTAADVGAMPTTGGVLSGTLTVKPYNNGYGTINKNNSATADYGMQFRDVSSTDKIATLIVSAANQKASLSLKPSADATASTYELYHEGNKPTAAEIQAGTFSGKMLADSTASATVTAKQVRNIYAGTASMTPGTTQLTSGDIYLQYR